MELKDFFYVLRRKAELILLIVTFFTISIFLFNALQTPEYSSTARIMIIQKSLQDTDAFIAARSSERLSIILSEVIYSNSFFNDVLASSKNIIDDFSQDPAERRKEWQRQVKNRIDSDKGIIEITAYDKNKSQSVEMLNGIIKTLTDNGEKYHGGSNISIRVIDEPLISKNPARPNILLNTSAAAILAFIGSVTLVYLFSSDSNMAHSQVGSKFSIGSLNNFRDDAFQG